MLVFSNSDCQSFLKKDAGLITIQFFDDHGLQIEWKYFPFEKTHLWHGKNFTENAKIFAT